MSESEDKKPQPQSETTDTDENIERICPEDGGAIIKDGDMYMCVECDFETEDFNELKTGGDQDFLGDGAFRDQ